MYTYIESTVLVLALAKRKPFCWLIYERDLHTVSRILTLIEKKIELLKWKILYVLFYFIWFSNHRLFGKLWFTVCKVLNTLSQELAGITKKAKLRRMYEDHFHSCGQHLCKFTQTKGSVCIRKEVNSQRNTLEHQHCRRFVVLEHQYRQWCHVKMLYIYSRTPVTQTLKGNKKQLELAGNLSYRGKFQWNFD